MAENFGGAVRRLRVARGWSLRELARRAHVNAGHVSRVENGQRLPTPTMAAALDAALVADGELIQLAAAGPAAEPSPIADDDDEMAAWELARRAVASDVGGETVQLLESAVDQLAMAYPVTPPAELLVRVRRHLGYVSLLLDGRKTLAQHQRLLVAAGWLSLLGSTVDIDLDRREAAAARLRTAAQLARQARHPELSAWCLETTAWQALTGGDYRRALTLSQAAQRVAPEGSSAYLQATAQEARTWARLGEPRRTRQVLDRLDKLVGSLPTPEHPEHHYRYDPAKAMAYTATTLAWVGDAAAEEHAREVIRRLESREDGVHRPRRVVSARLDLGLALLVANKPDEAAHSAMEALTSGRLVPSNFWRAREIVAAVAARGLPEAADLRAAYENLNPRSEI